MPIPEGLVVTGLRHELSPGAQVRLCGVVGHGEEMIDVLPVLHHPDPSPVHVQVSAQITVGTMCLHMTPHPQRVDSRFPPTVHGPEAVDAHADREHRYRPLEPRTEAPHVYRAHHCPFPR